LRSVFSDIFLGGPEDVIICLPFWFVLISNWTELSDKAIK